jgi:hypothetical protein
MEEETTDASKAGEKMFFDYTSEVYASWLTGYAVQRHVVI